MLNAVIGRSFSTTVWAETGVTSVIQGDASSWRRNLVYAWMSTVRPLMVKGTAPRVAAAAAAALSAAALARLAAGVLAGGGGAAFRGRLVTPSAPMSVSQV